MRRFIVLATLLFPFPVLVGCSGGSDTMPVAMSPVPPSPPSPAPPPPPPPLPPPPPPAAILYQSPFSYTVGIKDGLTVVVSPSRTIPIRVRYPMGFTGPPGEKLPVVIWSHGGGAKTDGQLNNSDWGDALTRAGYVVVHMSHIPRSPADRDALYTEFGLTPAQGNACFGVLEVDRPRDAAAVIGALAQIESQVPELPAQLDFNRVAMGGHSFGAYTVRTIGGARVDLCPGSAAISGFPPNWPYHDVSFRNEVPKAFLALSPQGPGRFGFFPTSWSSLNRPDITLSGDGDDTSGQGGDSNDGEQPADRIFAYSAMPAGEKWLMYISSIEASHGTFNLNNFQRPEFTDWVRSTGLAFLDTYLRGSTAARTWMSTNQLGAVSSQVARVEGR